MIDHGIERNWIWSGECTAPPFIYARIAEWTENKLDFVKVKKCIYPIQCHLFCLDSKWLIILSSADLDGPSWIIQSWNSKNGYFIPVRMIILWPTFVLFILFRGQSFPCDNWAACIWNPFSAICDVPKETGRKLQSYNIDVNDCFRQVSLNLCWSSFVSPCGCSCAGSYP